MVLVLALYAPTADAAEIDLWTADTFRANSTLDGQDGWSTGLQQDEWYGTQDTELAAPLTDVGVEEVPGNGYGSGWGADDWLIRNNQATVAEGRVEVSVFNEDDDTAGLVANHDGADSFYLVGWSADDAPPPLDAVNEETIFVIKVENGQESEIGRVRRQRPRNDFATLSFVIDDGAITIEVDGTSVFTATDASPLPAGYAGMYTYNSGYDGNPQNSTDVYFDFVHVTQIDEDDDGVADDDDNCEETPNEDQADGDQNGIGDACDEVDPDTDVPVDTDEPTDTDQPTDTDEPDPGDTDDPADTDGAGPGGDDAITAIKCGCASGANSASVLALLAAVVLIRRR